VEREDKIRPAFSFEDMVRSRLPLFAPANVLQGGQDAARDSIAIGSCRDKELAKFGNGFSMFEPIGQGAKCEGLHLRPGFVPRQAIGHHTWNRLDLGDPSTVFFVLKINAQHVGNPSGERGNSPDNLRKNSCNRLKI